MLNYFILVSTAALGIFNLVKDWVGHGSNPRRYTILILIVAVAIGGCINLAITNSRAAKEKAEAHEQQRRLDELLSKSAEKITRLESAIASSQQAQEINNKSFLDHLGTLYTKAQSEQLRKQIAAYQQRILKNMSSEPPANLVASFDVKDTLALPVTRQTTPVSKDGTAEATFLVYNDSSTTAKSGECIVRICPGCRFAEDPPRTEKPLGGDPTERTRAFDYVVAHTAFKIPTKIIVPHVEGPFQVGVMCGCPNCSNNSLQSLWIVR
ncbi:MAG: hypothetical protein ACR2IF_05260 [Terriglobales bacterium]